jgi:hypothetical protein
MGARPGGRRVHAAAACALGPARSPHLRPFPQALQGRYTKEPARLKCQRAEEGTGGAAAQRQQQEQQHAQQHRKRRRRRM